MSRPSAPPRRRSSVRSLERIQTDTKDPRWVKLFVEGSTRAAARIPRESLTELRITDGMRWTAAVDARVKSYGARREAREFSMGALAKRTHNSTTLADRLTRRGFDRAIVDATVLEMKADGWLDDDAHAESRAHAVHRQKRGLSVENLAHVLEFEGVDQTRAAREGRRVAGSVGARREALALARATIAKRGKKSALAVAGALERRGMDPFVIEEALRLEGIDFYE